MDRVPILLAIPRKYLTVLPVLKDLDLLDKMDEKVNVHGGAAALAISAPATDYRDIHRGVILAAGFVYMPTSGVGLL